MQHQGNDLGDGKNVEDERQWTIRSQALRPLGDTGAVQRLNGGGSDSERRPGRFAVGSKI